MNTQFGSKAAQSGVSMRDMANAIRALSMDAVEKAKSGHPGMPMGMADVATVLFTRFLHIDPKAPDWADRDRFVLSAGHGSMLQYALHYLVGYDDMPIDEIKKFRQLGARTAGHPEYGHAQGIETTTGPLGQGISTAVGMAIAERLLHARYGSDLVDHYTYVIAGDGCLMEGISHEAIDLAGHLKLGKLIVLWDDNQISIDGPTSLATSTDQIKRFEAAGWHVSKCDGHDPAAVEAAISAARAVKDKPSMIACKTVIGYGAPTRAGTAKAHGEALGAEEIKGAREKLGWPHEPFVVPADILAAWRQVGTRGASAHKSWTARLEKSGRAAEFRAQMAGALPADFGDKIAAFKKEMSETAPKLASRKSSEMVLGVINASTQLTLGGSADLTHSNYTITKGQKSVKPDDFSGSYMHYGVREHGMSAAMNGIALHGGFIPYGGTFMVFTDYARGAMRLSALMGQRVIYVMTHDSIGLGEDGPTHQPIEHLAMLRATPNTLTMRPADAVETAECWEIAIEQTETPSVLSLSRQALPTVRTKHTTENLSAKGAYVLSEPAGGRQVTIIATGSEVMFAIKAAEQLAADGVRAAVVSMPCWELFEKQSKAYQDQVLGAAPCVAVEAGIRLGWDQWIGREGKFIGMSGFGASAPADDLYKHFGITPDAVAAAAKSVAR